MNSFVRMFTDPVMLGSWPHLDLSLTTGRTAFDEVFGAAFFDFIARDPEKSALFNASMSQGTQAVAATAPQHYDFARFASVLDIGGGDGTLLAAVLRQHQQLRGTVFDSTEGGAQAQDVLATAEVSERSNVLHGDFFESIPPGFDLHVLKSIVHDWDDDRSVTILSHSRAALADGGRLLIIEPVLPDVVPSHGSPGPYLSDLNMLVNVGGRERTRADFVHLLSRSGFTLNDLTPLPQGVGFYLIEAVPA